MSPRFKYLPDGSIDQVNSKCFQRDYQYSKDYIGPINSGNDRKADILECHKVIGYPPDDYAKLKGFHEEALSIIEDNKKTIKALKLNK